MMISHPRLRFSLRFLLLAVLLLAGKPEVDAQVRGTLDRSDANHRAGVHAGPAATVRAQERVGLLERRVLEPEGGSASCSKAPGIAFFVGGGADFPAVAQKHWAAVSYASL